MAKILWMMVMTKGTLISNGNGDNNDIRALPRLIIMTMIVKLYGHINVDGDTNGDNNGDGDQQSYGNGNIW